MLRTMLTTAAMTFVLTASAFAQTTAPVVPPAAIAVDAAQSAIIHKAWEMSAGYVAINTDNLGTHLIGQPVYTSAADKADEIGKVTDIVFSADGQITAVVIGVGGFLGMGEKNVAVDFKDLQYTLAADNTERWVVPTTADALKAAPAFVWTELKPVTK